MSREVRTTWRQLFGASDTWVVGVAVRRGGLQGDTNKLLNDAQIDHHFDCAKQISQNTSIAVRFFVMTDTPELLVRAERILGSASTATVPGEVGHFTETNITAIRDRTFLEWFLFGYVDDAVLTWTSSFGYTAFAAAGKMPVTIDYRMQHWRVCNRQAWDLRVGNRHKHIFGSGNHEGMRSARRRP